MPVLTRSSNRQQNVTTTNNPGAVTALPLTTPNVPTVPVPPLAPKAASKYTCSLSEEIIKKLNECYTLTGGQISNIRKKLLVKSILTKDLNLEEYVQVLCRDEIILNKNNRTPIGFSYKIK